MRLTLRSAPTPRWAPGLARGLALVGLLAVGAWSSGSARGSTEAAPSSHSASAASPSLPLLALQASSGILVAAGETATASMLPNGEVEIPVRVDFTKAEGQDLAELSFELTWDPELAAFGSAAAGDFGTVTTDGSETDEGRLAVSVMSDAGTTTTFTALTLTLQGRAVEGLTTVAVTVTAAANEAGNDVTPEIVTRDLPVCVGQRGVFGDVNADDAVNIVDAQQVARFAVGLTVSDPDRVEEFGDVTGDGTTNIVDAQQVARFAVGLETAGRSGEGVAGGCNFPPAVKISSPSPGATFTEGDAIALEGTAEDPEEGPLAGEALEWTSDLDGLLGTGESLSRSDLSVGNHEITLSATDSEGAAGSTTVRISVVSAVSIARVSGDGQRGKAGLEYTEPLVVEVTDGSGNPVEGGTVSWSVVSGDGELSDASTTTDGNGRTSVTLTAGATLSTIEVEASLAGFEGSSVTFTAHTTVMYIEIRDNAFVDPSGRTNQNAAVTIAVGDTVEWEYTQGGTLHTATSGEGSGGRNGDGVPAGAFPFDSGLLQPGDTFRVVLRQAGEYTYFCEIHPSIMFNALITVEE